MQDAGTAGQVSGTEPRERRTEAPGTDIGARILAMARAAAAMHMAMATQGRVAGRSCDGASECAVAGGAR